jgi:DNA-binding MarR family transcriptional regulator
MRRRRNRPARDPAIGLALAGVRRLERGLRLAARQVERATGLSAAQLFVLEHLDRAAGLSLSELARETFTDRSSVSAVVDRLTDAGLARRTVDQDDKRRAMVRITARGRDVLARAPAAPTDQLLSGLTKLSRGRLAALGDALAALNDALGFATSELLFQTREDRDAKGPGRQPVRSRVTRSQR